jgi:predicted GNAT superfamily acetyltransferase
VANAVNSRLQRGIPKGDYQGLQVLPSTLTGDNFRAPVAAEVPVAGAPLAVPVPDDIGAIRRTDPELGKAWRLYMRGALEAAFGAGYTMVDCIYLPEQGWHYILTQNQA